MKIDRLVTGVTARLPGMEDMDRAPSRNGAKPVRIAFTVLGEARPQGSKIPQPIYTKDKKPLLKDGRVVCVTRNDNPHLESWREHVACAARRVYDGTPLAGPIRLTVLFHRPRPKGHYRTGRNAHLLRDDAPEYPTGRPDSTKLLRAVEDALTSVVWADDSQIVDHDVKKRWGPQHMTHVSIEVVAPSEAKP